jgi:hypothetical protein
MSLKRGQKTSSRRLDGLSGSASFIGFMIRQEKRIIEHWTDA